jgi:hypothetical protein
MAKLPRSLVIQQVCQVYFFVFHALMIVLDYPTADYIKNHKDAYDDPEQTLWSNLYTPPTSQYRGEC